jgi:hypothetical protein
MSTGMSSAVRYRTQPNDDHNDSDKHPSQENHI